MQPLKKRSTFEEVAGLLGKFHITPSDRRATELINSPAIQQFLSLSKDLQDQEEQIHRRQQIDAAIKEEAHRTGTPAEALREHVNMQRRQSVRIYDMSQDDSDAESYQTAGSVTVGGRSFPSDANHQPVSALAQGLRDADKMEEETRSFENNVMLHNLQNQLQVVNQQQNIAQQFTANLAQRVEVGNTLVQNFYADNRVTVQDNRQYQLLNQVQQIMIHQPVQVAQFLAQNNVQVNEFLNVLRDRPPCLSASLSYCLLVFLPP